MKMVFSSRPFLTMALVGAAGAAFWAADASAAFFRTYHPAMCQQMCIGTGSGAGVTCAVPSTGSLSSSGQYVNTSNFEVDLACPVVFDTNMTLSSVTSISAAGFSNSSSLPITLTACRTNSAGTGGQCGAAKATNQNLFTTAITDLSAWTGGGSNDGYYVKVIMPGQISGFFNSFFRYRVDTP